MANPYQRTDSWYQARLGKIGASMFGAIMTKAKSGNGLSKTAESCMYEIIAEIMTGQQGKGFTSDAIQHGIDNEDAAIYAYEDKFFKEVQRVGFVEYSGDNELLKKYVGCSPDGLIDADGMIEVKCLNTDHVVEHLLNPDLISSGHKAQTQGQLMVLNRKWNDYAIYDPRMLPEFGHQRLLVTRYYRDEEYIALLLKNLINFCTILDERLSYLRK